MSVNNIQILWHTYKHIVWDFKEILLMHQILGYLNSIPTRTGPAWWVMARSAIHEEGLNPSSGDINRLMMIFVVLV
jgi:hypothetical protein